MRSSVTLVAVSAAGNSAVGSRIGAFVRGLGWRGRDVTVIDAAAPSVAVADRILSHTPWVLRSMLESAGIEGDVRPTQGWRVRHALHAVATDVVVLSVPPFSLLAAAAATLNRRVQLVVDYRDPWSAPPPSTTRPSDQDDRAIRAAAGRRGRLRRRTRPR